MVFRPIRIQYADTHTCIDAVDTIALSLIFFLFSLLHSVCRTRLFSLNSNSVYTNTYLTKHMHRKGKAQHRVVMMLMMTAMMTLTMIFLFYAKFSLSLLRAGEHMQSYHNIENLYWNICQHVYQILKSVKSFKHKRPLNECDMMMCMYGSKNTRRIRSSRSSTRTRRKEVWTHEFTHYFLSFAFFGFRVCLCLSQYIYIYLDEFSR